MKKFISQVLLFKIGLLFVFFLTYFSLDFYLNQSFEKKDAIFLWGDSQTSFGIDLNELSNTLEKKVYSSAFPGAGVYDFLLIDSSMQSQGMDFFAMMLYIWIAMQYMRLMLYTSPPSHRYVSLTRVFTLVLAVSFGLCLFIFSLEIGVILAVKASIMAIVANVIFAYMFYYVFNEVVS